ncbi:unnamed protein product [Staurois parvus]|uniref:Uncharacterized protein n=1 Tax=Staurois parvus TaxID=386267 RepID=A0ABN9DUE4_9NEOB|nr:unnamed protein product [Staurois parvus]
MRGPGRADIVNAGSGEESGYSECGEREDIVNAGSGERGYSECRGLGRADIANMGVGEGDIVNAGSGESGYSECGVRGVGMQGPGFSNHLRGPGEI